MQDGNKESFCILNFTMALGKGEASNKNSFRGTLWVGVLPRWLSGKESASKCRRCKRRGCDPWVGESPWRGKWQPRAVFLPGESHGQRILARTVHGVTKSLTRLSTERTHVCRGSWSLEKRFPEWGEWGSGNWEVVELVERAPGKETWGEAWRKHQACWGAVPSPTLAGLRHRRGRVPGVSTAGLGWPHTGP